MQSSVNDIRVGIEAYNRGDIVVDISMAMGFFVFKSTHIMGVKKLKYERRVSYDKRRSNGLYL
jgi:hypothetical protein